MPTITINGKDVHFHGGPGSLVIGTLHGSVYVNGQDVTPGDAKQITITVTGDVGSLEVDACHLVTVSGSVSTLRTTSGDVQVAQTVQSVMTTSGDVECGDVGGNVSTSSGDVKCGTVGGSVRTGSGDIKHRRH